MSIFDSFGGKRDLKEEIDKSIEDFMREQDQFKYLKQGELGSLSDDDLRVAVMSWLHFKLDTA